MRSCCLRLLLVVLALGLAPVKARADHPHDLERARRALEQATQRLARAAATVHAVQQALDHARDARDLTARQLDQTFIEIRRTEQWLGGAEQQFARAREALAGFEAELPAWQAQQDQIQRIVAERSARVKHIRDGAWAQFHQADEFIDADRALADARAALDAAIEQAQRRMAQDRIYQQLDADAQQAEAYVQMLRHRQDIRPEELATASQAWLDAKSRAQKFRDEYVRADPNARAARAAHDDAATRQQALVAGFERSLEADPHLRHAEHQLDEAQAQLAAVTAQVHELMASREAAAQHAQALHAQIQSSHAQLAHAQQQLDGLRGGIASADADARRLEYELSAVLAQHAHALRERDSADYAYRQALSRFDREQEHRRRPPPRHAPEDRGKRYERGEEGDRDRRDRHDSRDEPAKKPDPPPPSFRLKDRPPPAPETMRKQGAEDAPRHQLEDQRRREERERREAEWQKRRKESAGQEARRDEPQRPRDRAESAERPGKAHGPQPPAPREQLRREPERKPEPKPSQEKPVEDRGERYRRAK